MQTRAIVSSLLLLVFAVVLFTGVGLNLSPSGKIANETGWNFAGLSKGQLENLHTVSGYIMSGLVLIHLALNYKMYLGEIRTLFNKKR